MNKYVIIVAGGSGTRMKSDIPKQFLLLKGKPLLWHTINAFQCFDANLKVIVVLPKDHMQLWEELRQQYSLQGTVQVVTGGATRFHSVKNGLQLIEEPCLVGIHDGVRPLVSHDTIYRAFKSAERFGTGIPVVSCVDSLRFVSESSNFGFSRDMVRAVQTPQVFRSKLIMMAYQTDYHSHFTDDASVLEYQGISMNLVEGNRENIKITTPFDLKIAEVTLDERMED